MLNSMVKIFVGPVMGGGLNPHQPPPPPSIRHWLTLSTATDVGQFCQARLQTLT
jgi:hypothetical protein